MNSSDSSSKSKNLKTFHDDNDKKVLVGRTKVVARSWKDLLSFYNPKCVICISSEQLPCICKYNQLLEPILHTSQYSTSVLVSDHSVPVLLLLQTEICQSSFLFWFATTGACITFFLLRCRCVFVSLALIRLVAKGSQSRYPLSTHDFGQPEMQFGPLRHSRVNTYTAHPSHIFTITLYRLTFRKCMQISTLLSVIGCILQVYLCRRIQNRSVSSYTHGVNDRNIRVAEMCHKYA